MYLVCGIRLDIAFVVRQFRKKNVNLRKKYLQVTKKVVKYLKKTI